MRKDEMLPAWRTEVVFTVAAVVIWRNGWSPDIFSLLGDKAAMAERREIVNLLVHLERLAQEMVATNNNAVVASFLRQWPEEARPFLRDAILVYAQHPSA